MNASSPVAQDRTVRLRQELVLRLRETGSIEGATKFWRNLDFKSAFGKELAAHGFEGRWQQGRINKVAFPDVNFVEVEAALSAGNNLRQIYKLAVGTAAIARDSNNRYQPREKRLKIVPVRRS
jgi:hypothetical protein